MPRSICLHKTSQIGFRESNEDKEGYLINLGPDGLAEDPNFAAIDFFIVCDGHGGDAVSNFVCPKLQKILTDRKLTYPLDHNFIIDVFQRVQKEIEQHPKNIGNGCGSTVLIVVRYMDNNKREWIQVINLGDCRAVMARGGLAMQLSIDHKPSCMDEKLRIDAVNRLHGTKEKIHYDAGDFRIVDLSVSRSMGDNDCRPFISSVPEIFQYLLVSHDEFIIVACDGCWDTLSSLDAVNFIRDHVGNNFIEKYNVPGKYPVGPPSQQKNLARKLAQYAISRGSTDNVSILVVFFNQ